MAFAVFSMCHLQIKMMITVGLCDLMEEKPVVVRGMTQTLQHVAPPHFTEVTQEIISVRPYWFLFPSPVSRQVPVAWMLSGFSPLYTMHVSCRQ